MVTPVGPLPCLMWPGNHASLLWEQPGLSLGVTGTEEDDTIPALVKLRFFHRVGAMGYSGRSAGPGARPPWPHGLEQAPSPQRPLP